MPENCSCFQVSDAPSFALRCQEKVFLVLPGGFGKRNIMNVGIMVNLNSFRYFSIKIKMFCIYGKSEEVEDERDIQN